MWVLSRVLRRDHTHLEAAIAALVEEEIQDCSTCRGLYESAGALPTHCPTCGRVRGQSWERWIEEQACHIASGNRETSQASPKQSVGTRSL